MKVREKDNLFSGKYSSNCVSVIIPTYNRQFFLKAAVESIVNQTYRPIECIIVDDGSTDDTKVEVEKIDVEQDNNFSIKYIYQENSGSQVARNEGTRLSKGEFVQYLDSDDLLYPEKIEKQVSFFNNHPECDAVFGDWEKGLPDNKEFIKASETNDMISELLTVRPVHTLAFLYRREIIDKIGEWDVNIKRNQEIDFQVSGLIEGAVYKYQPQVCGLWRIHDDARIANTTGPKEVLYFFHKWEKLLEERALLTESLKKNVANVLFWEAVKQTEKPQKGRIYLLLDAIRLDTNIPFYNTPKMRLMVGLMGKRLSLNLWLAWFKKHLK
jgi:glycosyltransferase involved in cell wall biosynthesis